MKIHNDFTLYFRVAPSGKRVVYFYAYDENGKRTQGRSTGQATKTAARVLVNRLLKEGALMPKKDDTPGMGRSHTSICGKGLRNFNGACGLCVRAGSIFRRRFKD